MSVHKPVNGSHRISSTTGLFCLLMVCLVCFAIDAGAAQIVIRLDDMPPSGTIVVRLYDSASAFSDFRDPAVEKEFALGGNNSLVIDGIAPGEYALVLYYDENANGRLDRNFIGIPTEPVGLANRYQPKGPPSYDRASFVVADGEVKEIEVSLWSPLGDWGAVGVGVGAVLLDPPYRDYDGLVVQPIPAVSYIGERFQIFGPVAQADLFRVAGFHLAATLALRVGAYEEKNSPFLEGMGDRLTTLMAGLALRYDLPFGFQLSAGYRHDVLDQIGGGAATVLVEETLPLGFLRFTPGVGLEWRGKKLSDHDFGVPPDKDRPDRPTYELEQTFSMLAGLGTFVEINQNWRLLVNIGVEILDNDIRNSPIVSDGYILRSFIALNYVL